MTTSIIIDNRELSAAYIAYLEHSKEVKIIFKKLNSGDILVNGLAIERKTVQDFFLTLKEGRLFTQLHKLKYTYRRHLLLIEGRGMRVHLDNPPFFGLYIRLAAGWQIPVLHTQDAEQTANCILRICHQDAIAPAGPIQPRPRNRAYKTESTTIKILREIPGIGTNQATALLKQFQTLDQIFTAEQKTLQKVKGIGKTRAQAIKSANGN